jgi:hypothetical protein
MFDFCDPDGIQLEFIFIATELLTPAGRRPQITVKYREPRGTRSAALAHDARRSRTPTSLRIGSDSA